MLPLSTYNGLSSRVEEGQKKKILKNDYGLTRI
jgi:hypothetical protein